MKLGAAIVLLGYGVIVAQCGWWGVLAVGLHIGSLFLFGPRR